MLTEQDIKILIVEDNPDTQTLLRYMLRSQFDLVFSTKVEDALSKADEHAFGLFLLDINLGEDRTGIELLALLREDKHYEHTPALALTAYAMPGDRERFLRAGFDGYVSKPFTKRDLTRAIVSALENKQDMNA